MTISKIRLGRVVMTGATGFIGRALGRWLQEAGYEVVGLSRSETTEANFSEGAIRQVTWDGSTTGGWGEYVEGAYAVLNLAGESVGGGRWTYQKKREILESRLSATRAVVESIEQARQKPGVVIQASAIGYYGDRGEQELDEESSSGTGFLAEVCREWEETVGSIREMGVRLLITRIGVVLGRDGGMLGQLAPLYRKYLGGCPGSGRNWLSWIHIDDVTGAMQYLMEKPEFSGVFNLVGPNPVRTKAFHKLLGKTWQKPSLMSAPAVFLKLMMGEMARELILASQKVRPKRLIESGYRIRYAELEEALMNAL